MPIIDKKTNILYWDGVNYQWLPYVRYNHNRSLKLRTEGSEKVTNREEVIEFVSGKFTLRTYNDLKREGIELFEISKNKFIYDESIITAGENLPSIVSLLDSKLKFDATSAWSVHSSRFKSMVDFILNFKPSISSYAVTDHLGNQFSSYREMAIYHKINYKKLQSRISRGCSIEKALQKGRVQDHFGNWYASNEEMCKAYNIKLNTYKSRRSKGWSLKKSLTTQVEKTTRKKFEQKL